MTANDRAIAKNSVQPADKIQTFFMARLPYEGCDVSITVFVGDHKETILKGDEKWFIQTSGREI